MKNLNTHDSLEVAGLLCITAGCFLFSLALGFIIGGICLVVLGVATGRKR